MRKRLKWLFVIFLTPMVLLLLAAAILYIPAVQNAAVRAGSEYFSEKFGIKVELEKVRLSFPLDFSARNVCAVNANNDTLLFLDKLTADVKLRPLFKGNLSVKGVTLEELKINTLQLIGNMAIRGEAGKIALRADSVLIEKQNALINAFLLQDADIEFFYCDTTLKDTSAETAPWRIELGKIELQNVRISCALPCDSVFINTELRQGGLENGVIDLGEGAYRALNCKLDFAKLHFSVDTAEVKTAYDTEHLRLSDLKLSLESLFFSDINDFQAVVREFSVKNGLSDFCVKNMTGSIVSDSFNISIPSLSAQTANSTLQLQALVPWDFINGSQSDNSISISLNGKIGKQDVMLFFADTLKEFYRLYPDKYLKINAIANGSVNALTINELSLNMPGCIDLNMKGFVSNMLKDSIRSGNLDVNVGTQNLNFLTMAMPADMRTSIHLPDSMSLSGKLKTNRGLYAAELNFEEQSGKVGFLGEYNIFSQNYDLQVVIDNLRPIHFLPEDSLMLLSGSLHATGKGTDIFNKRTFSEIRADIAEARYANYCFTDLSLTGKLQDNELNILFTSDCPVAAGNVAFDGTVRKNDVQGKLTVRMDTIDFKGLNITDSTFSTSFRMTSDFETNLKRKHSLDLSIDSLFLTIEDLQLHPDRMTLTFRSEEDTVKADFNAGDLNISLTGNADLKTLINKFAKLSKEAVVQLKRDSLIDMQALRPDFPDLTAHISSATNNLLYSILQEYNIFYEAFSIDATVSSEAGLNADGILLSLVRDTFKIDTVQVNIWQDTLGLRYSANVLKNRFRNQSPFKASANGFLYNREADIFISFINRYDEKGLDFGINMKKASEGFDFHLYPQKVTLAFIPFTLNEDNYFTFKSIKDMNSNLFMKGENGASLQIQSEEMEGTNRMSEIMIEVKQIELEKTLSKFSDIQSFKGNLSAMLWYQPTDTSYMLAADGHVSDLYYNNGRIGEILLNATCLPIDKNKYQIDFHTIHDMNEIATLSLLYTEERNEKLLNGIININRYPMKTLEPFLPENTAKLNGNLYGLFHIKGTSEKPLVSGVLRPDSISVFAIPSSTLLSFENKEIEMENNIIDMDKYNVFIKNNPFVVTGNINAQNLNSPVANISISGSNVPLMDAKNTPGNLAYGKLFVNLNTTITGPLQSLRTRGNLNILGKSGVTYVMPDERLEAQDGFNNIVKFTYFADTLPVRNRRFSFTGQRGGTTAVHGSDVFFTIHIDPVVWFNIDMDPEKKNYIEMKGGGDLTLQYTSQGDMLLNGRYSLSEGNIRYNIPVIPLTDFIIRNGSYIDWSGNPMNPYLNITAYSRIRSSVKSDDEQSRMVDFNAGIRINNYLDKIAPEFILEAPNDVNVQNQLASMGAEERSKQAISLLVTGVYLASGGAGTNSFDMNTALSSFLQRELKNMIGKFLGEVPLSFEILTYDGLFGLSRRIDYIGRLQTNLFSDRFNTTVGLRYTTDDPLLGNKLLIDDITLEYMIDTDGSRAVSLFRNKEYKNIFEGETGRTGASFTIRKKVRTLGDLFWKKR